MLLSGVLMFALVGGKRWFIQGIVYLLRRKSSSDTFIPLNESDRSRITLEHSPTLLVFDKICYSVGML